MRTYRVRLFRAPRRIRGWFAYINATTEHPTVVVELAAASGAKAKNSAITAANNAFRGVKIVHKNYTDPLWGLNNFPVIKYMIEAAEKASA